MKEGGGKKRFNHKEPSAAKPQPKKTFNRKGLS